jgi:antitoxin component YwqK of YwqJK toxin-antitoxin module
LKYALEKVVEELSSDERQLLNESSAKERGLEIFWNENGLKKQETNHDCGNKGESLTTLFYDNGNKLTEGCTDGNKQVGIWVKFSEDGKADGEIHHINGQTHLKYVIRHEIIFLLITMIMVKSRVRDF